MPFAASPLAQALAERGYVDLTPVQHAVLADAVRGRDLLVSAQTGSGKTVAYGLALGDTLLDDAGAISAAGAPVALVVAPTRELALQVERELRWLYAKTGARVVACVGGMDPRAERRRLELGCHIVVGTPGRLLDHIQRRALVLDGLKAVVLDEADEMLDLGFREDLEAILESAPAERRTLLFSATIPSDIVAIARRFQRDAARVETAGPERGHADIEHRAVRVLPREIGPAVVNLLRQADAPAAIVFCATREAVRRLHATLSERGFPAVLMSGELSQNERNRALQELRDGRARVCVATDVAARGIDLPSITLVIHADLPHDAEVFQHRSGRTGRAGRKGVSVLLVPPSRRRKAETMMVDAGVVPTWSAAPTAEEIHALDQKRLLADPALTEQPTPEDIALAHMLMAHKSQEEIAVALARLHRARLPAPEDVTDPGERQAPPRDRDRVRDNGRPAYDPVRSDREPAAERRGPFGEGVWFRLAVGRRQNADPKWLLPLICRRGGVTRDDIGAIRIFDAETKVEIAVGAAEDFAASALGAEKNDVAITRAQLSGPRPDVETPREPRPAKPYGHAPKHAAPRPRGASDHPRGPSDHRRAEGPASKPQKRFAKGARAGAPGGHGPR